MTTKTSAIRPFQVGATFVGAAIGAGFATGQELLQFFGYFGPEGLWGVMLAATLLGLVAYSVLDIARRRKTANYRDVVLYAAGDVLGTATDYLITFFLFGGLVSMIAGSGALMGEQFGWNRFTGAAMMAVLAAATVSLGLQGIVDSMTLLAPMMVAGIVALGVTTAHATGYFVAPTLWKSPASAPVPSWPLSAVIYASYNLILTVAVLAPFGVNMTSREDAARGAAMGGVGLGVAAAAGYMSIASRLPEAAAYEVPMMFVAGMLGPAVKAGYALIIMLSMYTTAISVLYGFVFRLPVPSGPAKTALTLATPVAALVLASAGFTNVVRVLYPSVGVAGIVLLATLTVSALRH